MVNIEISQILKPISAENSCGEDMAFSSEFHAIKKARTEDDLSLDQGEWVTEPKVADWTFVERQSLLLLEQRSKDIRLLCWLNEAWTHNYGFYGLAKSLELIQSLFNLYWDNIYPIVFENDLDQRIGIIQGMINAIPQLIKQVPLVSQNANFNLMHYENLLHQQNNNSKHAEEIQQTIIELEQFEKSVAQCSIAFTAKNYDGFMQVCLQWASLKQILNRFLHDNAPRFATLDTQLEQYQYHLKKIYKVEDYHHSASTEATQSTGVNSIEAKIVSTVQTPLTQANATGFNEVMFNPQTHLHLQNRQQALKLLQQISDYFATNEPHSPVSYQLNKTIQWSQLPLHEWLAQVIKNEQPLESIQEILGVKDFTQD